MDKEVTLSVITIISLVVNAVTIYRWIADYLHRETLNDQAFHMLTGLAKSMSKRVSMIVKRINMLQEQNKENDDSMIFLENMWGDSMATIDNLLATAKALKPSSAKDLPYDASDLLRINSKNSSQAGSS
ncbi:MAG: hypothetical protein JAZ12_12790 [Candidatus Thiodiazotropha taylori]|nr:hypothetical protein [Candidatus Thiodiazotropha taylori]